MTHDIIARLKKCWCADAFTNRGLVDPACDHDGVRAEAADEIERLQTENAFLRKALVRYGCEYVEIISAVTEWDENE